MNCFVTQAWSWKNRSAARRFLRRKLLNDSVDMAFIMLRGAIVNALHRHNYGKADRLLADFRDNTNMSKTQLKKALLVVGTCITTGAEEFQELHSELKKNKEMRANLKDMREFKSLCALLVNI